MKRDNIYKKENMVKFSSRLHIQLMKEIKNYTADNQISMEGLLDIALRDFMERKVIISP